MADRTRRLQVPLVHGDEEEHRRQLAERANISLPKDGSLAASHPVLLAEFTVATLPDAAQWEGGIVYVSDEAGGATVAVSNGTNWVRLQDLATVS